MGLPSCAPPLRLSAPSSPVICAPLSPHLPSCTSALPLRARALAMILKSARTSRPISTARSQSSMHLSNCLVSK